MLLLMRSCWNGQRRTSADSFMLCIVLVILTAPSSMPLKTLLLKLWMSFYILGMLGFYWFPAFCFLGVSGFTLRVLGWSCWGKETFPKRSTPMLSLVLVQNSLILLWNWRTVSCLNLQFRLSYYDTLSSLRIGLLIRFVHALWLTIISWWWTTRRD